MNRCSWCGGPIAAGRKACSVKCNALTQSRRISDAVERRFWDKVERGRDQECWLWRAHKRLGYGRFLVRGKLITAHRYSHELHHGPVPPGSVVMHSCDVRACVNPAHLRLGTQLANVWDAIDKGRWPQRFKGGERWLKTT